MEMINLRSPNTVHPYLQSTNLLLKLLVITGKLKE